MAMKWILQNAIQWTVLAVKFEQTQKYALNTKVSNWPHLWLSKQTDQANWEQKTTNGQQKNWHYKKLKDNYSNYQMNMNLSVIYGDFFL